MRKEGTLGEKVRRRRVELGLSQQQLAGTEMSRSFISLVERNLCRPSGPLLQVIAARLEKPAEYFLEEGNLPLQLETSIHLMHHAEAALKKGDMAAAANHAAMAAKLCTYMREDELCARSHRVLAACRRQSGDLDGAMEELEQVVECYSRIQDKEGLCKGYLELGNCAFGLEDFRAAERYYRRVLALASGLKSRSEEFSIAAVYVGSCLMRLGRSEEAVSFYYDVLAQSEPKTDGWFWAMTALSLGWAQHKLGRVEEAMRLTEQARTVLTLLNHPDRFKADHNLAIMKMHTGALDEALATLRTCQDHYRTTDQPLLECSVTEDIATCFVKMGDLTRARAECDHAIKLLEFEDSVRMRGKLYLQMAHLHQMGGQTEHARPLVELALAIFRRLRTTEEMNQALRLQGELQWTGG